MPAPMIIRSMDAAGSSSETAAIQASAPFMPGPLRPATVVIDGEHLRMLLDNLLANARLHTPPGTGVVASVVVDDGAVRLEVRDDGPGIAPADRARVFDRFWQATRADESAGQGTGLGLAIVRSIARAHGGEARLDGAVERGTAVVVELPLAATAAQR